MLDIGLNVFRFLEVENLRHPSSAAYPDPGREGNRAQASLSLTTSFGSSWGTPNRPTPPQKCVLGLSQVSLWLGIFITPLLGGVPHQ